MKTWHIIVTAIVSIALAATLIAFAIATNDASNREAAGMSVANAAVLVRPHVATTGKPDAKVHIVEFLDPACETCRDFYPRVKKLLAEHPDAIRLSVRMVAFHKGADFAVKALEASKKQGKYWPTLERLLASQSRWTIQHAVYPDKVWAQLQSSDLDLRQLKIDMESPEVLEAVAMDARDARTLKVAQTPEYFVNGRGLPEFGWAQLQRLVADEMAKTSR